ncbi:Uncharacterised protein [Candidatus Anstonella stagnisolia]|nr:Uncharacterised protein [Candidatus Anstonella stagnisolia]
MKNYLLLGAFALLLLFAGCVSTPSPPNPPIGANDTINQTINKTVWLSYSPIQCKQNTWEIWEANSGRVYIRAPTEKEILTAYYSQIYDVQILNYSSKENNEMVCAACNCPRGDTISAKIYAKDSQKMLSLGWKEAQEPAYNCPQLMPPSPDFCTNGKIVSGGVDSHGCQMPPKCVQADLPPNPPN